MNTPPLLCILTWCQDPAQLYGTLLTFKTLRVGFPTAPLVVFDNASLPAVRPAIRAAVESCGGEYRQIGNEVRHHDFICWALENLTGGELVFLDPDLVFWKSVEHWQPGDCLAAGRLIPACECKAVPSLALPRLHTSFLWVPSPPALCRALHQIGGERMASQILAPYSTWHGGKWLFWDTAARFYAAVPERCQAFTEQQLNAYDHLLCGTHFPLVAGAVTEQWFHDAHAAARGGDIQRLKGMWRAQEAYFERGKPGA